MRLGNRKCTGDSGSISSAAATASRSASKAGVASASGWSSASMETRADILTTSLSCGCSKAIQVMRLPKKSASSRRSDGSGEICSEATCTVCRGRPIGVSRSTWRALATGEA